MRPCIIVDTREQAPWSFSEALSIARRGLRVLPLEPRGKNPLAKLVRHGVAHATDDPQVVSGWYNREPTANIGIETRGLLVVDADLRRNGPAELAELEARHGKLPHTPKVKTGGNGLHVFFQMPDEPLTGELTGGIDLVHGPRRYVVAAPSVHPSGGRYEWVTPLSVPFAPAPAWLIEMARRPAVVVPEASEPFPAAEDREERARLYVSLCDPAVSGQKGRRATWSVVVRVARGFALSESQAFRVLNDWNRTCTPPWPTAELQHKISAALNGNGNGNNLPMGTLLDKKKLRLV